MSRLAFAIGHNVKLLRSIKKLLMATMTDSMCADLW